jgi:GT2 family glycosyltransferase
MEANKVCVIMVNYNTTELIPEVLRCINEDKIEISILIVDNGSTKASYNELLHIKDNRVHVVRLEENIGIGGGNNYGIQYAAKHFPETKYVFLLNTDAFISTDLIYNLVKIMSERIDAACISPNIITRDGDSWFNGLNIDYKKGSVAPTLKVEPGNFKEYYEVEVFNGCAVLFDLQKLLQGGMLNDKLYMYYEEAHLSIKLHKLGYKILYTPHYTVVHYVSFTTRNTSYLKSYYMTRNKFITFNDTMTLANKIYFIVHEFAYHLKHKRIKNAMYHLRGFIDFKKGKSGKLSI